MRREDEIVQAHDMLDQIILAKLPGVDPLDDESASNLVSAQFVLCWVLEHEDNRNFGTLLEGLQQPLRPPVTNNSSWTGRNRSDATRIHPQKRVVDGDVAIRASTLASIARASLGSGCGLSSVLRV